jgi:hypothetical protein
MRFFFLFCFLVFTSMVYGQSYKSLSSQAINAYDRKDYSKAVDFFKEAFKIEHNSKGDIYDAACSAALSGQKELAFEWLELSIKNGWTNINHMKSDKDLFSLHDDARWTVIVDGLQKVVDKLEANFDKALQKELLDIYKDDQDIRHVYIDATKKYGFESKQADSLGRLMAEKDASNLTKIRNILDSRGWVGPEVVGSQANQALFLVIQHSDLEIQQKYLPMMREAVKNKKANGNSLALLEDRIALGEGRNQKYGSQIGTDKVTGKYYVLPLENPDDVDVRRAEVGLGPIAEYVSRWNIVWDVELYKKELPMLEAQNK